MNKPLILCALAALAAFGQSQTPLTITQSAGSATGELRMQERRTNGTNYVGIKAPQSVAANTVWALPAADGTSNQCLSTDGAGQWGWRDCSGASTRYRISDYFWIQTPGGSISPGLTTVTLTPCPSGLDATDTKLYVYISVITAHGDIVAIDVDLAAPVTMSNFSIMAASPQVSAGAAVRLGVDGSTNHNCGSKIDNLFIYQFYYGIHLKDGCKPVITRNEIADSTKYGIYAQNIFNPDGGDGFIAHNTIGNTPAADAAIRYESGGGLKIIDNKILNNFQWGVDLYPNSGASTGQLYITSNSFDRMKAGGIRASGTDAWYGVNVIGNIIIDAGEDGTFTCVEFANPGMVGGSFVGNMCQSGQYAITASQGTQIRIGRNNFTGSEVINSSVDIDLDSPLETTHANIPTDALDGSVMYCTDCTSTGAASGTGAAIYRVNGAWSTSSTGLMNISQGGDTFGVDMHIGTDDSHDVLIYRNNVLTGQYAAGQVVTYGYHTFADNGTTMRMQPGTGVGNFGNFSNHPIDFYTDSAARWRLSATGMLHPSVNDAVDAGLTGTRIRGVYAKFGEFYKSGSTASADYLTTRKYNILDQSGGTGVWDIQASGSMAATSSIKIRDNAGSRWLEAYRALGGTPLKYTSLFGHLYPAKRLIADGDAVDDSVFGDLGATSARWANIYGAAADLSGALTASGNITGAVINATGSPAYRVNGTTVINASREATFVGLTIPTGAASGYLWTSDGSGVGSWQAAASVTAPLTLTLGAAGYSEPLIVANSTNGVYGSCMAMAATDTSTSTVYTTGRICGRYDSASFADELVTIQTASGVGAYDVAMTFKNQAVTMPGTLDVTGNISGAVINATGSPAYRVSGTTVINASREATFTGLTIATGAVSGYVWTSDGSGVGSWQAAGGGWTVSGSDVYRSTGIATVGHTSPVVRLGQNFNVNYAGDYAGMAINTWSTADGHGGVLDFNKSGNGTIGTQGAVVSGETLGLFVFRGSDGTAFQRAAQVMGEVDGTVSSGVVPGRILLRTASTSGVMTERLRIDSAGLASFSAGVDIIGNLSAAVINATGSPAYRVSGTTVIDASRNATFVALTATGGAVTLLPGAAAAVGECWIATSTGGAGDWDSCPGSAWTVSGSDVYRSSGNVGIGTSTPNAKLSFGTGTGDKIFLYDGGVGSSYGMALNAGGIVRIFSVNSGTDTQIGIGGGDATFSPLLTVKGSGNVGIGTTGPDALLTVNGVGAFGDGSASAPSIAHTGDLNTGLWFPAADTIAVSTAGSERWRINSAGHFLAGTDNSYDIGASGATRPRNLYVAGTGTFGGAVTVGGVFTPQSTITGDLIPTTSNVYVNGSSSSYWNQVRSETFYVENSGRIRPTTTNTGSVGISTARFNKGWFTDLDITGTVTPPSGTAFSGTKTVRASGGASDCTLTFSSGIMTGGTC
jgi:hypothetical protein